MAFNFPNTPTIGDQHTDGGITWEWDGIAWNRINISTNVSFDDLTDVTITTPVDGALVAFNLGTGQWQDVDSFSALFNTQLSTKSTTDLAEGTNLYYTQGRFDSAFTAKSTTDLSEGTNLYFTDERVDDRVANLLQPGANITLTYNDVANTLTIDAAGGGASALNDLTDVTIGTPTTGEVLRYDGAVWRDAILTTSNVTEGTNLYYTTTRANSDIDTRVTKAFVDALNVDADTLDGIDISAIARTDISETFNDAVSFNFPTGGGVNISETWGIISPIRGVSINGGDEDWPVIELREYTQNAAFGFPNPLILSSIFGGTTASPSAVLSNTRIMGIEAYGAIETGLLPDNPNARITMTTTENQNGTTGRGTQIEIATTPNGNVVADVVATFTGQTFISAVPIRFRAFPHSTLVAGGVPDQQPGDVVCISDAGYKLAYYDGSFWRYVSNDGAV